MHIVFLARSLERGGTERQLIALAKGLHARGHRVTVATFYDGGELAGELEAGGVRRVSLGKSGRWDLIGFAARLRHLLAAERPDILHGYLPPANIAAALMRPLAPRYRLVWGVRAGFMDLARYDRFARLVDGIERRLSRRADLIIANSQAGLEYAVSRGFPRQATRVVHNGIDTARFAPRPEAAQALRAEWGVAPDAEVVGLSARLDPIKDHETFLRAFKYLTELRPKVRGAVLGDGPEATRTRLQTLAKELSIAERVVWLPFVPEPASLYSAFDVACSSSAGESFPNTLAEAMACGVPCVATRVGESETILGDTGVLVSARDPVALGTALAAQLERCKGEPGLGAAARQRIEEHFSLARMIERSEQFLSELV